MPMAENLDKAKPKLYWYTADGLPHGPVTGRELKLLAKTNILSPEASVWEDGRKTVVLARNIPRLFEKSQSDSKATSVPDTPQVHSDWEPAVPSYPVLRIERTRFSTKLLAIYKDHVLYGKKYWGELILNESAFQTEGENELSRKLTSPVRIATQHITRVCGWRRSKTLTTFAIRSATQLVSMNLTPIDCMSPLLALTTNPSTVFFANDSVRDQNCSVLLIVKSMIFAIFGPLFFLLFLRGPEQFLMNPPALLGITEMIQLVCILLSIFASLSAMKRLRECYLDAKWRFSDYATATFISLFILIVPILPSVLLLFDNPTQLRPVVYGLMSLSFCTCINYFEHS